MNNSLPTSIIIFGASGDLTQRKLIPSLFNLCRKERMPKQFRIIGYGGTAYTDEAFRAHLEQGVKQFASFEFKPEEWADFAPNLSYLQGKYDKLEDFEKLSEAMGRWENGAGNRIYYMATPPGVFPSIIDLLGLTEQLTEREGWRRVVIEKPFGTDLTSAQKLNTQIHKALHENQIYRIDHYLGKETVQNILVTRFSNTIFEPLWNRNYIDHVEITVAEQVGATAVEQILGRVLRQPNAQAKKHVELNRAYAFATSLHFANTANSLADALIQNGFEKQEVRGLIQIAQQQQLTDSGYWFGGSEAEAIAGSAKTEKIVTPALQAALFSIPWLAVNMGDFLEKFDDSFFDEASLNLAKQDPYLA